MICSVVICTPLHPGLGAAFLKQVCVLAPESGKQETKLSSETPGEACMKDRVDDCRHISKC